MFDTIVLSLDPVEERKQAVVDGGCPSSQQGLELISLEGGLWDRECKGPDRIGCERNNNNSQSRLTRIDKITLF